MKPCLGKEGRGGWPAEKAGPQPSYGMQVFCRIVKIITNGTTGKVVNFFHSADHTELNHPPNLIQVQDSHPPSPSQDFSLSLLKVTKPGTRLGKVMWLGD